MDYFSAVDDSPINPPDPLLSASSSLNELLQHLNPSVSPPQELTKPLTLAIAALSIRVYHLHPSPTSLVRYITSLFPQSSPLTVLCLSHLPDLLCGEIAGRRLSIAPPFLSLLYRDLQSPSTQSLLASLLPSNPPEAFRLAATYAHYVPLLPEFVGPAVSLALPSLTAPHCISFLIALCEGDEESSMEEEEKQARYMSSRKSGKNKTQIKEIPSFREIEPTRTSAAIAAVGVATPAIPSALQRSDPSSPGGTAVELVASAVGRILPRIHPDSAHPIVAALTSPFLSLTTSTHTHTRSLLYEPLESLAAVLNSSPSPSVEYSRFLIAATMNLASSCVYPASYFHNPCAPYDHEFEIERNDVRDLLRTVALSPSTLEDVLSVCLDALSSTDPPEPAYHTFSALAKNICTNSGSPAVVNKALACLGAVASRALQMIKANPPVPGTFPADFQFFRISMLALSSNVPLLEATLNSHPSAAVVAGQAAELACLVAVQIKEYPQAVPDMNVFVATLEQVSGEVPSPGGEDH